MRSLLLSRAMPGESTGGAGHAGPLGVPTSGPIGALQVVVATVVALDHFPNHKIALTPLGHLVSVFPPLGRVALDRVSPRDPELFADPTPVQVHRSFLDTHDLADLS